MTDTIEVGSEVYKLNGNPSLGTVRKVQSMQMDMITDYVGEDQLREMDSLEDEGEIIQAILDSGGYEAFQDVMWERSMLQPVQTISLAVDEPLSPSDFDDMGADDFKEAKESAEDVLGGDASDFFNSLGIGLSLNEEEMRQTASQKTAET